MASAITGEIVHRGPDAGKLCKKEEGAVGTGR